MIWVTTLDDKAIEDKMNDFRQMYPLSKNKVVQNYKELLPASLILGTKKEEYLDYCGSKELQALHDFFQGCYSFTLFHFIVKNAWPTNGQIRHELSKGSLDYRAEFITSKWTEKIQAQNFLSDQTLDKDNDFMELLKQLPPYCIINQTILLRPPSLFGDFFRDLNREVFLDENFLSKNNCIDFDMLKSAVSKAKLSPHTKNKVAWYNLFAFYNHKTRNLLFHYRDDDDYVFKILSPIC